MLIPLSTALLEFRDLWSWDWSYIKLFRLRIWFGTRTVCMCWMDLELCTGVWCKNWPAKELVPPSKALPEFLDLWGKDWSYIKTVQVRNWIWKPWTVCMRWMDLELRTGVWCKNWPSKELVAPSKALPEFLDLWGKDWSYMKIGQVRNLISNPWTGCLC